MPRRPGHPCRMRGCPEVVAAGIPYCEAHAREVQRQADARRGSASQRGYGVNWRRLRGMFLAEHPLCADPYNLHGPYPPLASEVDHKVPRARGGSEAWENLQALCKPCHSRKTAEMDSGWHK